jgi:hypothetical protein
MTQSPQYLDTICERVHQAFVDHLKVSGTNSYLSRNGEELMVPWSQLSEETKNRQRQECNWHIDAIQEQAGAEFDIRATLLQTQPKTKTAGSGA